MRVDFLPAFFTIGVYMTINTEYFEKSIETLCKACSLINTVDEGSVDYEMYRNSLVKSFEMTLEQSGKLLRKKLTPFFATKKSVDQLTFKDLFRHAFKYSLLTEDEVGRWFKYRDNRNNTAHDYGRAFAEETLSLMDDFIKDVNHLKDIIENE